MYRLFLRIEKAIDKLRELCMFSYYKAKYGKRLVIGKNIHFRKGLRINISKDGKLKIGDNTFFNGYCSINCHNEIIIGKENLFGEGVRLYDHNHVFNDKAVNMKKTFKLGSIRIGDRNWFGSNVVVLNKTQVGNNNVFGANMVVNSKYDSDNIVRLDNRIKIEKIRYRVGWHD